MNKLLQTPIMMKQSEILKKTKKKLSNVMHTLLKQYEATNNELYLQRTTFKYIYIYKTAGKKEDRLDIALADFGFTIEEIDSMKLSEIISDLLGR
jgi:hypothetical protein